MERGDNNECYCRLKINNLFSNLSTTEQRFCKKKKKKKGTLRRINFSDTSTYRFQTGK